jgi:hypothetical protein
MHAGPPSAMHVASGLLRASALLGPAPVPSRGRRGHPQPKRPRGHPQRARDGSAWGGSTTGAGPPSAPRWSRISDQAPSTKPLSLPSPYKVMWGREPFTARGRGFLVYFPSFSPFLLRAYSRSLTPFQGFWRRRHSAWRTPGLWGRRQVLPRIRGILTRSHLPKPKMGWGCCLPPGCFPAAAPQAFLCIPNRTLQASFHRAYSPPGRR